MKNYKIRWKPECSLAIIYWSITFICLFLGLTFILERAEVHWKSMIFFFIFLILVYCDYRRVIIFHKNGIQINYARFWKTDYFTFDQINFIRISGSLLMIYLKKQTLEMRLNKKQIKKLCHLLPKEIPVETV